MKAVTAEQMRQIDRRTMEAVGIPGPVLMENAGRAAVCVLEAAVGGLSGRKVAIFCGRGNNGGDGLVIARYLRARAQCVDVYLVGTRDAVRGDAALQLNIWTSLGESLAEIGTPGGIHPTEVPWHRYDLLVDALLGTGLSSEVSGPYREIIDRMNEHDAPIFAVDIPSGLSSDNGRPLGACTSASVTATFGLPKVGQVLYPGRTLCGDLYVVDIGIPPEVVDAIEGACEVALPEDFEGLLGPPAPDSHKGHFGHLLVIGGSAGKTGAAAMVSEAALRCGAGLVTLGVPMGLNPAMEAKLTEVMTLPLPGTQNHCLSEEALHPIKEALKGMRCMALGPGLSTEAQASALARRLAREVQIPVVIDADGLNALVGELECVREAPGPRILTPHPGEMARLLECSTEQVQADRIGAARRLAHQCRAHVVLKGAATVVSSPEGRIWIIPAGNPALASAGTGDVLTGIIAALVCQGLGETEASVLGAYLHGAIADEWAGQGGYRGLTATDLIKEIPRVLSALISGRWERGWPKRWSCPFHA